MGTCGKCVWYTKHKNIWHNGLCDAKDICINHLDRIKTCQSFKSKKYDRKPLKFKEREIEEE